MFKGKEKAWLALVMPAIVAAVFGGLKLAEIEVDPSVELGAVMILTALGVYQIPNTTV